MKLTATLLCSFIFVSSSLSCTTNDDILTDIIFVVDGSGSIGDQNFELVKAWLINATTIMFDTFGRRAQFQVLEYSDKDSVDDNVPIAKSTKFEIPFRLGDCESVRCMSSRIQKMKYLRRSTYTYYALKRTMEVEFPLSDRYLISKKAIILLTDGAASDYYYLPKAYEKSVEEGVTIFAIGVGIFYDEDELKIIANGGNSSERVYKRTTFRSLASVIRELQMELAMVGFFCDECSTGDDSCSEYANCSDTPDSYQCECKAGYTGDGFNCKPIDYCASDPCYGKKHSECIVKNNKPHCACKVGFREEKNNCVDINECESSPCAYEHSLCTNTVGNYMCTCAEGYVGNGTKCSEEHSTPNDIIVIVTFLLAIIVVIGIVIFVVVETRKQRSYSPNAGCPDSEASDEMVPIHEIRDRQYAEA